MPCICVQPVYFALFGFHVFGLGFVTSMVRHCCRAFVPHVLRMEQKSRSLLWLKHLVHVQIFIFMTGIFVSSWMGTAALSLGEWIIKKLPLVKHIYSAAKQVTAGLNPENENARSFRECVLIRHPRHGEYAFGFITGETILQVSPMHRLWTNINERSSPNTSPKLVVGINDGIRP